MIPLALVTFQYAFGEDGSGWLQFPGKEIESSAVTKRIIELWEE